MTLEEEMKAIETFDDWRQAAALAGRVATVEVYFEQRRLEDALVALAKIHELSWNGDRPAAERLQQIGELSEAAT